MNDELLAMIDFLERDRGLEREIIVSAIEEALDSPRDPAPLHRRARDFAPDAIAPAYLALPLA